MPNSVDMIEIFPIGDLIRVAISADIDGEDRHCMIDVDTDRDTTLREVLSYAGDPSEWALWGEPTCLPRRFSTPICDWKARDIATHYTYSADRVQLYVVDESTVLAVGFDPKRPHRATGRVAWIRRTAQAWASTEPRWHRDQIDCIQSRVLVTLADLDALAASLRGES